MDEDGLWRALTSSQDLVTEIASARWSSELIEHPDRKHPGSSVTFSAGVLSRVDEFDAEFFGISPREAAWLDPQQRLLLEMAWEAMENSGVRPSSLAGTDCAVYVGISGVDYGMRALDDLPATTAYSMTGNTLSIAANRISYAFDLHGPSVAVDTACSSSLVALHHACNALNAGEAKTALVGGVNLLLHPYPFIGFTKASMLSKSGRCRAFDAFGDGYVRAEGGAVLLLKPLSRAISDGDDIQAVILASGINADGGRKTGVTIPSTAGQIELMRAVLARSGVNPEDIVYIEAHGTGTIVGDPVEAQAIGAVYGRVRNDAGRLPIGSVKTNLGHLEPASGMAGLIKAILVLKNRTIPPSLHFETPNPHIDFDHLNLDVVTENRAFPKLGRRRAVVGVNSFGFGGANAHVLLQEHRSRRPRKSMPPPVQPPLFLSARTTQALRELAGRYADKLRINPSDCYDLAYGAAFRRDWLDKRVALDGMQSPAEMSRHLSDYAQGKSAGCVVEEDALGSQGGVAFVYSGNGSQWLGMGKRLLSESPRFFELMNDLDARISVRAGFSIIGELSADEANSRFADTAVAQPLLFSIQVALTTLLIELGVQPQAVTGHSVGEVAAAWTAGTLSLDQAVEVICARSEVQALTRGAGRMAAVGLSAGAAKEMVEAASLPFIEIACINSPSSVTLSGDLADLEALESVAASRNVFFHLLDLDYAFHSRHMDMIKTPLLARLGSLTPTAASRCTFVSTVTGDPFDGRALDASYWWRNVRSPVRFADAIQTLAAAGCTVFVEIGPHAILQRYMRDCIDANQTSGKVLPTLRRNDDGLWRVREAALRTHLLVGPESVKPLFPVSGLHVQLPNYPWQRERHWHPVTEERNGLFERKRVHPLLGWRLKTAIAWENCIDTQTYPWLADHQVAGAVVFPGAAYAEMALAAAREHFGIELREIEDLDIVVPIVFDGGHARSLRFELHERDCSFRILSRPRLSAENWTLHAAGRLLGAPSGVKASGNRVPLAAEAVQVVEHDVHYRLAAALGLEYGPAFQGLGCSVVADGTLEATVIVPPQISSETASYALHPATLDVCFQSLVDFFQEEIEAGDGLPLLPVKIGRLSYYGGGPVARVRTVLKRRSTRSVLSDFELLDKDGQTIALLSRCCFRATTLKLKDRGEPSRWKIGARLKPLPLEGLQTELPTVSDLLRSLQSYFAEAEPKLQRSTFFKGMLPLTEALVVAFAAEAFAALLTSDESVSGRFRRMLDSLHSPNTSEVVYARWLASLLQAEGVLVQSEEKGWCIETGNLPPAETIWRTILRDYPDSIPDLVGTAYVGQNLGALLLGDIAGPRLAQCLCEGHLTRTLFDDSPVYAGTKLAVQQLLLVLSKGWPIDRRLRVLEVTRGAASLTPSLVNSVGAQRLDYVIARPDGAAALASPPDDVGNGHLVVATIDQDALSLRADENLPSHFDVVILRHWLHETVHPARVLVEARNILAHGGLLVIAERHPDFSANFIAGADPAWWQGEVAGRAYSRLRYPTDWESIVSEQRFVDVRPFMEPASDGMAEGSYLLLAKRANDENLATEAQWVVQRWLVLSAPSGSSRLLAEHLQCLLESFGQAVCWASTEGSSEDSECGFDAEQSSTVLERAVSTLAGLDHVVWISDLDTAPETGEGAHLEADFDQCILGPFHLVKALATRAGSPARLWLVTAGGALSEQISTTRKGNFLHGGVWGLGRVVMNEYPALACTLIDLDIDTTAVGEVANRLANELLHPDGETEILLTPTGRRVLRMERVQPHTVPAPRNESLAESAARFRLDFRVPGQIKNLLWLAQAERPLAGDEVEVQVAATGLNFRDVMYLMGLLPDEAVENGFAGATLGLEFSGVVTRVGAKVTEYSPGDDVMGFGSACFASHVITRANALTHKPTDWPFELAATVPTAFFTAYYALKYLADLQSGERVLIHGAAGGVGIAAVQLALHLGAEVFATAGSKEKRHFVKLLGAEHVFDSRSLTFSDEILALTGGEGVDVVLNSLSGEAIRRNLTVLKPFGRFLELGKRDFFENTPIGLRPFKDNISYFGIDADQLLITRPTLAGKLFREVMALFRAGALFPLPYRVFEAEHVVDAFRTMQQSRHIGKVVVRMAGAQVVIEASLPRPAILRLPPGKTWLVTGGLSGFGLASARWLAERGVDNLVLVGRRGQRTPGIADTVRTLEAAGVRVQVVACDITDREAVRVMLDDIRSDLPPLSGILHAAMVLDDALMANLDAEQMRTVLAPKILGAWHLHELTQDIPLEHFILYSSVTSFFGNPGQANYVAANGAMERLASLRRRLGLPATCVAWGPIGDAGYLTQNQSVRDKLQARLGAAPLTTRQALSALDQLLADPLQPQAVANFNWQALERSLPSAAGPRFKLLRQEVGTSAMELAEGHDLNEMLAGKSPEEALAIVQSLVACEVAKILSMAVDRLDHARSLHDLGMDSLMAVELALGLETRFGLRLPVIMLSEGPTVERVSQHLLALIQQRRSSGEKSAENDVDLAVARLAEQHGEKVSADDIANTAAQVRRQMAVQHE